MRNNHCSYTGKLALMIYPLRIFLVILCVVFSSSLWAQNFQTGDIIFHTSRSAQSLVIQKATHSPYSHMGLIVQKNKQWWVLEAVQPVKYTPLKAWIARGVDRKYVVKRYHKNLTAVQQQRLVQVAERSLGKPYDVYFEWDDQAIYCSEIVWKAYQHALGIQLAPLQKLKDFDLSDAKVKSLMQQRYGQHIPLQETVIAPQAIFASKQLLIVR